MERRDQKLAYLREYLLSTHIVETFPEFSAFIEYYLRYLDDNFYGKLANILDNNDYMRIYDELLSFYFSHYFNAAESIPPELIVPGDDQKRLYIVLSKLINNLKGTRSSFEIMTAYINGATYVNDKGVTSTFGPNSLDLTDFISHEESYWDYYYRYGRQGYDYPFSYSYKAALSDLEAVNAIQPALDLLQPAGYVFRILIEYPQNGQPVETVTLSTVEETTYFYANIPYRYDGLTQFSGTAQYKGMHRVINFTS